MMPTGNYDGLGGITAKTFTITSKDILLPLTHHTSIVTLPWTTVKVTPIHKFGEHKTYHICSAVVK